MSDSKNRAGAPKRRHARVIKVAPVTRAIRAALAVSATALALTASGAVFAGNAAVSAPTALHHQVAPFFVQQPVIDLTTIPDHIPSNVVHASDRWSAASRPSEITSLANASLAADPQTLGDVHDLMLVGAPTAGPGGVSGTDNHVYINLSGTTSFSSNVGTFTAATSTTGFTDFVFAASDHFTNFTNNASISATGYTWAAGMELEAVTYADGIRNSSTATINATATGQNGEAWGIYAVAGDDVHIYNDGTINVSASGKYGTAVGLYSASQNGDASAANTGTINATASGKYGTAVGVYASAYGAASGSNTGTITVNASGTAASGTGISVYSSNGTASATNSGSITVTASGATSLINNIAGNAIGISAYAGAGDVSVNNDGSISATSAYGLADGIFASGAGLDIHNTAAINVSGYTWAAGIEAQGTDLTTVTNTGDITSSTSGYTGQAFGIYATGDTTGVSISNTGSLAVSADQYGNATGIYANGGAGSVSINNDGRINAVGYYSNGIVAVSGGAIDITNTGGISAGGAYGPALATGISASNNYEASDITVVNSGQITAYGAFGGTGIEIAATGAGSSASVTNSADIYAGQSTSPFGYGATGILASGDLNATIDNSAGITVYAGPGNGAYGALALAFNGAAILTNSGAISAVGYVAMGLVASSSNGTAYVDNSGSVYANAYYIGHGVTATGTSGAGVVNSGGIEVQAAFAYGIYASSGNGDVAITNTVDGVVQSYGGNFAAGALGLSTYGDVSVVNAGVINTAAFGEAVGAFALSSNGNANVDNSGHVESYSYANLAVGAFARADYGVASINNSGYLRAVSYYGDSIGALANGLNAEVTNSDVVLSVSGYGRATGIDVSGGDSASVTNDGGVLAVGKYGGDARGVYALANGDITVTNGDGAQIQAASLEGRSFGVLGYSFTGNSSVVNAGSVDSYGYYGAVGIYSGAYGNASATNSYQVVAQAQYNNAIGISGYSATGNVDLSSSGSISATVYDGNALGISAYAAAGDVDINNSGTITANNTYYGNAFGTNGFAALGDVTQTNSSGISAYAYYGSAFGMAGYAVAGDVSLDNATAGTIQATANYGNAFGLNAYALAGDVIVTNSGSVGATSYEGAAIGLYGYAAAGDSNITNSSTINVQADNGLADGIFAAGTTVEVSNPGDITSVGYGWTAGIEVDAGDASITNAGTISATGNTGKTFGIYATVANGLTIGNAGSIDAIGYAGIATGIQARAGGAITVSSTGDISVGDLTQTTTATGIYAANSNAGSNIQVTNGGDIAVYGGDAAGINVFATGTGSSGLFSNTGTIYAEASNGSSGGNGAMGALVVADGSATISNGGSITTESAGSSYGAVAVSLNGDSNVTNAGDISVSSSALKYNSHSAGIVSQSNYGAAHAASTGDITVDAKYATGIVANGYTGATIVNSGSISVDGKYANGAMAYASNGDASVTNAATGVVHAYSSSPNGGPFIAIGLASRSSTGNASISNAGSVYAEGQNGGTGARAYSEYGDASVVNSGDIHAYGYGGQGLGVSAVADAGDATVSNSGSIDAMSYYGNAMGVYASARDGTVTVGNEYTLTSASAYGEATGILALGHDGGLTNSGSIMATGYNGAAGAVLVTYADGLLTNTSTGSISGTSRADAYGAYVGSSMGVASLTNAATIDAVNTYVGGTATGAMVYGNAGAHITNRGTISAEAAAGSQAFGVVAYAYGNVLIQNIGTINATNDDYAVGVSMDSAAGTATLVNTGVVRTYATSEGEVAVLGGDGVQHVVNYGDIYGAVITGGGDDVFDNGSGGTWHVTNHSTDFGDGDDAITNGAGGTIVITDGAISLGSSTSAGNAFTNNGILQVQGSGMIDMGTGSAVTTLVPSLNPLPLTNNGVIDFVDGAADDMLTIAGDLGGHGAINIDISPLNLTSDLLYVDGSVADGTVQTVNVNFAGMPTSQYTGPIAFAHVTGDSTAGAFVGGQVIGYTQNNFLNLQVNVTSALDATNAADDVFSIGVNVAGLNATGTLAASLASGAQSLMNSQIGTWRQRMGVLPERSKDMVGLSPWIRVFSDKGEVDPSHGSNFGAGGNFNYDQSNSGREFGMNVDFGSGFNAGLLLAKSDATQRMSGVGSDHIHGSAFGLYGTWIGSNGFYVDASYRWMDFNADLRSPVGLQKTDGVGGAFNVEAGFTAWTMGGVDITPQAQYTRSHVGDIRAIQGDQAQFVANGGSSTRGRLGVAFSKTIQGAGWVWTPYGSVNAIREFDGETNYTVANTFNGFTSTEGTSAMVEVGVGAQKNGLSVTGGANWTDGGALQSFVGGQLVLRYTW
jgi:hypothetical protein